MRSGTVYTKKNNRDMNFEGRIKTIFFEKE
jgi:hypothetical protein